jgi:hypothetical protein
MRPFHLSASFSIGLLGTTTVQFDYNSCQYLFGLHFGVLLTNTTYNYVVVGGETAGLDVTSRLAIRSAAASFTWSVHITKQGTPKFTTETHYILATISLKFRAQITKFQGDVP